VNFDKLKTAFSVPRVSLYLQHIGYTTGVQAVTGFSPGAGVTKNVSLALCYRKVG